MKLDPTETSTLVDQDKGTPPYMPPEFHTYCRLSAKTDVFSYGIFLFELVSSMS